jgi:hypothetical protein
MANVDKAFGLRALGNLSATGGQKQYGYEIEDNQSGAIYQGDLVTIFDGYLVKFAPATHTAAVGVFNGVFYTDPTTGKPTWKNYYPGSVNITQGKIIADVIDDPNQLFIIQADEVSLLLMLARTLTSLVRAVAPLLVFPQWNLTLLPLQTLQH